MRTSVLVLPLLLAACGEKTTLLPDGGRQRVTCTPQSTVLAVKVEDAFGAAVNGATVTAKNVGSGKTLTGLTDGAGTTDAINGDLGLGTSRLSATLANQMSQTAQVELTCGECSCSFSPDNVTLRLNP